MRKTKRRIPKPKPSDKVFNIYHPELADKIEEAFKSNGTTYYNFKQYTEIPAGRYMVVQNFLQEVFFRMDLDRLKQYINTVVSELDNSKGSVNIGNAIVWLHQMKTLTELAFEPETIYRLSSGVYFDDTEDLRTWNREYNVKKISGWKENGTLDFFFSKPFIELTGLKNMSQTDIQDYLDKVASMNEEFGRVLNSRVPQK